MKITFDSLVSARHLLDQCFAASRVLLEFSGKDDEFGDRDERGNMRSFISDGQVFIYFRENAPYLVFDPSLSSVALTQDPESWHQMRLTRNELVDHADMFELAFFEMVQLIHQQIYGVRTDRYVS